MRTSYVKERAGQMRARFLKQGIVVLQRPALMKALECGIRFFLGGTLAGAEIFNGHAPFGLAFVAASGAGLQGLSSLAGVSFCSLLFMGFTRGLKYVAAAVLIFSVSFSFYDTRIYKKPAFMPLIAAAMTLCTGFVYLSEGGFFTPETVFFATEVLLAGSAAYFYKIALSPGRLEVEENRELRQTVSMLILIMGVLVALASVILPAGISLGRLAATLAVLVAAARGGIGMGSAAGISAGLAMDLAGGGLPFFSVAYAFAGLITGVVGRQGKLPAAAVFVLAGALTMVWAMEEGLRFPLLYESAAAAVIFLLIPAELLEKWDVLFQGEKEDVRPAVRARELAVRRLEQSAAAFRELYEAIGTSIAPSRNNDNDAAVIFDRTASRICRKCALASVCWEKDYVTTFNALNDAVTPMLQRGKGIPEDYPRHFSSRCLYFPRFLAAANEELTAFQYRRQFGSRLRESRSAVCRQYADLSGILSETAAEIGGDMPLEPRAEKRLQLRLKSMGLKGRSMVFIEATGRLRAEIEGEDLRSLLERLPELEETLGVPLAEPRLQEGSGRQKLILLEAEPLAAAVALESARKQGEAISGDCATYFKNDDGTLYLLLSDGMGSGEGAARESAMTLRLMERFLRAGIEPEPALKTLNSALSLRGEEGSCNTVDLMKIGLFNGETSVFKFGAAPTYVRKSGRVSRITCSAMPAGALGSAALPDVTRLRLAAGDWVVMVSDGLADGVQDEWIRNLIASWEGEDPEKLARYLLEERVQTDRTPEDDKTVLVLCLKERQQAGVSAG